MSALTGQIALVTGASSGIGKAIALGLAHQHVTVCLVGRKLAVLQAMAESTGGITHQIRCYPADLTLDDDIRGLVAQLQRDFRHIDFLIHSAGVLANGPLETAPVEDLDWQYRINVRAPYLLTQALLPLLKARRGQIVFINSTMGLSAKANAGQYAATKHALKAIADSLRAEVNPDGVRIVSVFPGNTATPMQAAVHQREGRTYRPELLMQPEDVAIVVINTLSLPHTVEVTDIYLRPMIKSS